jgi:hypothetical protein
MDLTWCIGVQSTLRDTFSLVRLVMASTSAFIITRSAFEVVEAMADKIGGAKLIAREKASSNSLRSSICENLRRPL